MNKYEITDSQEMDPERNSYSSSQESIHSMDKPIESKEGNVSVGKFKLSDSSINNPEEIISVPSSTTEIEKVEMKPGRGGKDLTPSFFLLQFRNC